jgi:hypothetical protein
MKDTVSRLSKPMPAALKPEPQKMGFDRIKRFLSEFAPFEVTLSKYIAKNIKANVNWLVLAGCRLFILCSE